MTRWLLGVLVVLLGWIATMEVKRLYAVNVFGALARVESLAHSSAQVLIALPNRGESLVAYAHEHAHTRDPLMYLGQEFYPHTAELWPRLSVELGVMLTRLSSYRLARHPSGVFHAEYALLWTRNGQDWVALLDLRRGVVRLRGPGRSTTHVLRDEVRREVRMLLDTSPGVEAVKKQQLKLRVLPAIWWRGAWFCDPCQ